VLGRLPHGGLNAEHMYNLSKSLGAELPFQSTAELGAGEGQKTTLSQKVAAKTLTSPVLDAVEAVAAPGAGTTRAP
jgi:hypothetical protein